MRVALFITCLADAMFPDVGRATVTVLERLGHQVEFPAAQTCCGQMHVNTGYQKQALPLVERFAEVFAPYDAVVAPSGSCVGSIRHQHRMIAERFGTPDLVEQVDAVAAKTFELSELLVDVLGVTDVGAYFPHRVTYHPTCHSLRMLRVGDKPAPVCSAPSTELILSRCPRPISAAGSAAPSRSRTPTRRPRCWPTRCGTCRPPGPRSARPGTVRA